MMASNTASVRLPSASSSVTGPRSFSSACGEQVAALAAAARGPLRIVEPLRDHLVQHVGVLAHIERGQVKAEGIDAPQQPLDVEQARVGAAVGLQAVGDERDVVAELAGVLVAAGAPLVGAAQPLADLREEHAVGHAVVARGRDGLRARAAGVM